MRSIMIAVFLAAFSALSFAAQQVGNAGRFRLTDCLHTCGADLCAAPTHCIKVCNNQPMSTTCLDPFCNDEC
jgi:hypothetical protein